MTKPPSRQKRRRPTPRTDTRTVTRDRTIYLGLLIIGAFGLLLWWLISPDSWGPATVGYVIALAVFVNHSAWLAWRGRPMPRWRQALARLPLRFAGYGKRGGKPLEAAHGQESAKAAIFVSIAASMAIILVLSFLLIPELRSS